MIEAIRSRLAGFARTLRDQGFQVGLAESRDALKLLTAFTGPAEARAALRSLLCGSRAEWQTFDSLFDAFWLGRRVKTRVAINAAGAKTSQRTIRTLSAGQGAGGLPTDLESSNTDVEAAPTGRREGASRHETLSRTDFRRLADPAALAAAHALAERLARAMRARLLRRDRITRRGQNIDLRRTIRASLATGGTPIFLHRRQPRRKQVKLVLLLDASGSMELYTAVFVRFVHGVLANFRESDAFLFHTGLVQISAALREKDASRALDRLGLMAEGVGGGTRIGACLQTFNRYHAARVIHSRTCVIILSDGYDTGEPAAIAAEMSSLRRRCRRIVWLNPLLGWDGYEPTARGMAAARPFIDLFAPAHTIESLAALEPYLARL
jgi:uncharacterized protein with von Willebrand factor type A (vWA) domain